MAPTSDRPGEALTIRSAAESDCSDLVVLVDIASRGLLSWLWSQMAGAGQSPLEVGRERIRTHTDLPTYYRNWHIAEWSGGTVGAMAGYRIPDPFDPGDVAGLPAVYEPLLALEHIARGTWHMMALAVFPAFRRRGVGSRLLAAAEKDAASAGDGVMTIIASSVNQPACSLYLNRGYEVRGRRDVVAYPGSRDSGEWLLFQKRM